MIPPVDPDVVLAQIVHTCKKEAPELPDSVIASAALLQADRRLAPASPVSWHQNLTYSPPAARTHRRRRTA